MEPLAKLVIATLELAETELALLKRSVIRLALAIGMLVGAAIFGITGLFWLLEGLFKQIVVWTKSEAMAYLIGGVIFVAAAAILGVLAFGGDKKKTASTDSPAPQDDAKKTPTKNGKPDDPATLRIAG